jgi:hypothetical protein
MDQSRRSASFSTYFSRYVSDSNSIVNATILDPANPVTDQSVVCYTTVVLTGTCDWISKSIKSTRLSDDFLLAFNTRPPGRRGFPPPERTGTRTEYTLQITETALLNEKTVNETRFQLSPQRSIKSASLPCRADSSGFLLRRRITNRGYFESATTTGIAKLYFVVER